jgi:hypothetical protein
MAPTSPGPGTAAPSAFTGDGPTEVDEPRALTPAYLDELAAIRLRPDAPRIYVSFRGNTDERLARRLALKLAARFGEGSVVLGGDLLRSARPFRETLQQQLDPAWVVVAILGPDWHTWPHPATPRIGDASDPVRRELERALQLRAASTKPERLPHLVPILREGVDLEELVAAMPPSVRPVLEEAGLSEPDRGWTASEDLKLEARIQRLIAPLLERAAAAQRPDTGPSNRLLVAALVLAILLLVAAGVVGVTALRRAGAVPPGVAIAAAATVAGPTVAAAPPDLDADGACDAHPYACVARDLAEIRARLDALSTAPATPSAGAAWEDEEVARLLATVERIEAQVGRREGSADAAVLRRIARELSGLRGDVGQALAPSAPPAPPAKDVPEPEPPDAVVEASIPPPSEPIHATPVADPDVRWRAQVESVTASACSSGLNACRPQVAEAMEGAKARILACLDVGGRDAVEVVERGGRLLASLPDGQRLVCR